ncbi:type II toxin-antitoxin system PemK/MazF family toxin [Desulfosporosinus sp. BICA1-9]|uniref:type II toxin-antitoxin system PemK/MazF family toxin n=1 Tax=Desulfosporosinus sp. BICA1-9 TaxID=1531958 RepID=UPI00054C4EA5|nr:type II toxin-antitoxin system PemK/MazF family toxin [Desulfosporosinus sp. BICA1-9]KJS46445.1 MAG: PemK family transcriptional regulator [Peptococcaceae bacterium BRH_c23]KJS86378.1 MAG: PemK family transcriptional regulator [Desulfosporosinus sp. BICA1-9]HBW35632.1 PemK family transcriptional regulator [Desulfosporosinus sp.]
MIISNGDVWFAKFPLEEDGSVFSSRPVIILNVEHLIVLVVKVTKTPPRSNDKYDIPINYWQYANLRFKSTARVSKTQILDHSQLVFKIGILHPTDFVNIHDAFMRYITQTS